MIEDHSRGLFGIVHPGGKCIRFTDFDGGRRAQEWYGHRRVGFVYGLGSVGPVPAVSRALRLRSTGRGHPVSLIRLGDLTAQSGVIYPAEEVRIR